MTFGFFDTNNLKIPIFYNIFTNTMYNFPFNNKINKQILNLILFYATKKFPYTEALIFKYNVCHVIVLEYSTLFTSIYNIQLIMSYFGIISLFSIYF